MGVTQAALSAAADSLLSKKRAHALRSKSEEPFPKKKKFCVYEFEFSIAQTH
jgi:hypothetical protein